MKLILLLALAGLASAQSYCPSDTVYDTIMDRCYKYVTSPMTFQVAQQFCLNTNGLLIDIHNITENMFVAEFSASVFTDKVFWIGLSNLGGPWTWDSGVPVNFTSWAPGQPGNASYVCATSAVTTGVWTTAQCSEQHEFICSYPAHPSTARPPTTTPGPKCPVNHVYYDQTNACYYVGTGAPYWSAETTCQSLGGHLTSIHSSFENSFVMSLTSIGGTLKDKEMTWIGLHYTGSGETYIWTDGSNMDYRNWESGMPSSSHSDECVELLQDNYNKKKGQKGRWDNQPCDYEMRKFVCKRAPLWLMKLMLLLALAGLASAQSYCPSDTVYDTIMDRCYKYVTSPMAFQVAQQFCLNTNGLLIDIQNITENMFVAESSKSVFADSTFWIGLSNLGGPWAWDSGVPVNFTSWAPGQPGNASYVCATSAVTTGVWTTAQCSEQHEFICSYPAHPSTARPPTTTPGPKCPANHVYYDQTNACYYVGSGAPYWSAESFCQTLGGHLTSIHSAFENSFVMSLTSIGGTLKDKEMTWIGLHYTGTSKDYIWTDGTNMDYRNWESGMPYGSGSDQCGELLQDNYNKKKGQKGRWDNQPCDYIMRKFVCKRAPLW